MVLNLAKMYVKFLLFICVCILIRFEVAQLASFLPANRNVIVVNSGAQVENKTGQTYTPEAIKTTTAAQFNQSNNPTDVSPSSTGSSISTTITTTLDPNADPDDQFVTQTNKAPGSVTSQTPGDGTKSDNRTRPVTEVQSPNQSYANIELSVLYYSLFLVYISCAKLFYHNVNIVKRNTTEPGVLMVFGILWELVWRQLTSYHDASPKFNSRVFFYLFLPSTVLDSASLLANKWILLNLLQILIQSILGTILYASSLGYIVYIMSKQEIFNMEILVSQATSAPRFSDSLPALFNDSSLQSDAYLRSETFTSGLVVGSESVTVELNNLTLADCLALGTILSSVDSSSMIGVLRTWQVDEKLYYLLLGENLMNNAVVFVLFELLLDFLNVTKITVFKIYLSIIEFFITLIGSAFIGIIIAAIALLTVRFAERLELKDSYNFDINYQHQYKAMVETLLIIKLAYLAYILADFAGTSSIISLVTFGMLQDQYIKHNLILRSQLTFKQVILAAKTMGFSLVYPLLGMLLVEVVYSNQSPTYLRELGSPQLSPNRANFFNAASIAASKLSHFANQANLHWNFKFLSVVTLLTFILRFIIVISLGLFSNLFLSGQLKITAKEQILLAYGGLKGPLAFALVYRLIEHEEYKDRSARNKNLFISTILFITLISTLLKGSLIKPLVSKMKPKLSITGNSNPVYISMVFNEINDKVTSYVTSGFNSILGHTKSPYDRFVEFNANHMKPWLARNGSNINWLSVFYDNLVLDETLNATCFSSSLIVQDTSKLSRAFDRSFTDNIDTQKRKSIARQADEGQFDGIKKRFQNDASSPGTSRQSNHNNKEELIPNNDKNMLKELVMFNLKVENAKRRHRISSGEERYLDNHISETNANGTDNRKRVPRMLSTTSSDDQGTSSVDLVDPNKQPDLKLMEKNILTASYIDNHGNETKHGVGRSSIILGTTRLRKRSSVRPMTHYRRRNLIAIEETDSRRKPRPK